MKRVAVEIVVLAIDLYRGSFHLLSRRFRLRRDLDVHSPGLVGASAQFPGYGVELSELKLARDTMVGLNYDSGASAFTNLRIVDMSGPHIR